MNIIKFLKRKNREYKIGIVEEFILMVSAIREGARITKEDLRLAAHALVSQKAIRIYIMLLIIAGYIFGLIGRIHFALATFIFLSVFFLYVRAGKWWSCLILAAAVAAARRTVPPAAVRGPAIPPIWDCIWP